MTPLDISKAAAVQFPMVRHAAEVGWTPLAPAAAIRKRGGQEGTLLREDLDAALGRFNPWMNAGAVRAVVERIEARPSRATARCSRGCAVNGRGTTRPRRAIGRFGSSTSTRRVRTPCTSPGNGGSGLRPARAPART